MEWNPLDIFGEDNPRGHEEFGEVVDLDSVFLVTTELNAALRQHINGVLGVHVVTERHTMHCRARRTARHLCVSDVTCIVMYTSPLKTNTHVSRFELSNLYLFLYIRRRNAEKFTVLGCHGHDLNTDHKRRHFYFRKCTEIMKEGIWSGLFWAAYQNGDQYYDVGPLCPIRNNIPMTECQLKCCQCGYITKWSDAQV